MNNLYNESILVCVYYGPNGERLIKRGCKIANMLQAPLYILTIDPKPFDELDAEKVLYIEQWKKFANSHESAQFIIKDNESRPISKVIAEVARDHNITQIVLGQTAHSRWEQITKGSIINSLVRDIPFVDLHIISVARYIRDEEGIYEKGVRAYLMKDGDKYQLSFNHDKDTVYEGIFFKEVDTDFDNGIFRFMKDAETLQVLVTDGTVTELKNVDVQPAMNLDNVEE
ncbi:universal stress protein [Paenibacillus motobuensis]|uniref:Histidine kinase n=1 Tax=Paenibacillus lutimineralis TaxID=2707005 RepID=A0A3Q9I7R8_9BACL|nr:MULTISPECIES: universal stress protein [Paenibacillus]AZS13248.1 histidine kinase [Paenibacillus lutimineralis]MCM3041462.1 universal stress protein [Paenibacillus lutimineralis]MCM3648566.1 universal stress protein [Paenibacillus motobuensis]